MSVKQGNKGNNPSKSQKDHLLAQMDITMVQKLAFASAHFQLHDGARILDIGCANGKSSYHMALLNPRLQVVGIDYDQDYIDEAKAAYDLPNLSFIQGDVRNLDIEGEKFDAIFNSSVMHEIYSFSNYDPDAVTKALKSQLAYLKPGGIILFRDFMRAADPDAMVYLDLPPEQTTGTEPKDMSYGDLLKFYARIADTLKPEELQGFYLEEVGEQPDGWRRFYLPKDRAYEFIWRKEYRERFVPEAREKYAVWSAQQYRDIPEELGARVLYTAPYHNPWIEKNWNEGKFRLFDEKMRPLPAPPSNFISVVQKIRPSESQKLFEHKKADTEPHYLRRTSFENTENGEQYDLVSRPGEVYDVIPYGVSANGNVVIYAKSGYPRPIINTKPRQMAPNLDGKTWSGHVVETLGAANGGDDYEHAVQKLLKERTRFRKKDIKSIERGISYFTAPADVNEKARSTFVNVDTSIYESRLKGRFSGFADDGTMRAFDVQDILRGVQVGMLAEARLEMNLYVLMKRLGVTPDNWIGDDYMLSALELSAVKDMEAVKGETKAVFKHISESTGFLQIERSLMVDQKANANVVGEELEFAVPSPNNEKSKDLTTNSVMVVPVVKDVETGEVMMGIQNRHFPAVQEYDGESNLLTVPGYRVPNTVRDLGDLKQFVESKYDGAAASPLGAGYFPTMGISPNRVFPYLVTGPDLDGFDHFDFVPLREAFAKLEEMEDAHMILATCRLVHALGLWDEFTQTPSYDNAARLTSRP